ncbi:VOC family protein [Cyclobacterium marinum]|uniref:Glyoxalase/bleomycin resistance protein/dioxygenase n=1 Tax=Cyclobacterium marinum (strain ATCC 25205 / DSM 745 / LMG 13164 / NCIMB 1802) TaxID=880070 RepID=G0IYB5_CYCMS|nr:VOC family protein [Cyclobacterium marinum]AEL25650.1 Glyoxalase/bleomycin resistance protein/dioxygenase [Cyclobacterium marinum DSM 745]MBR9775439.1 VOC family protein [Cytophagales bacterium]|tara:strand:- start:38941 stop:39327 length:387 start_codon:yes stop_codon:yes gene_type:complete
MNSKVNPVNWFEIYVEDMERAKKFYSQVLDQTLEEMKVPEGAGDLRMVCFPYVDGGINASGALVKSSEMKPGTGGTLIYFSCKDCAVEQSRIAAAGGQVVQPKFQIGEHGYCAIGMDTEGNTFGLYSM